jgi:hypothetical protein
MEKVDLPEKFIYDCLSRQSYNQIKFMGEKINNIDFRIEHQEGTEGEVANLLNNVKGHIRGLYTALGMYDISYVKTAIPHLKTAIDKLIDATRKEYPDEEEATSKLENLTQGFLNDIDKELERVRMPEPMGAPPSSMFNKFPTLLTAYSSGVLTPFKEKLGLE